jgi:hypothetical protein
MVRSRLDLTAPGLCILVACLFLLASSNAAQAETGAGWGYFNTSGQLKLFDEGLVPQLQVKSVENKTGILLFSFGGTPAGVLCTSTSIIEGGKLISNGTISLGRVSFSECLMTINGKVSPCIPTSGGKLGVIQSKKVTGLLVLRELPSKTIDPVVVIKPDTGTVLAEIEFGEECALSPFPITGELVLRDCQNELTFHKVEHLFEMDPTSKLNFGAQPAAIDGSAQISLAGAHLGLKWAGLPA